MHRTLSNLAGALDTFDLDLSNVAKLTVLLADMEDFHAMHGVWTDRFEEGQYPARSVLTSEFVSEDILVQVEGIVTR